MIDHGGIQLGPVWIANTVVTTWGLLIFFAVGCWWLTRSLQLAPGPLQTAVEGVVGAIHHVIVQVLPQHGPLVLPFVATLWIFLVAANLVGLIPGLVTPTGDLATTSALAVLVFLSVHWFGIRSQGPRRYLGHYLRPSPILLPFHVIGEFTRTIALALRLFGNMMSMDMAAMLVLMVVGLLAPVPLLMLHVVEALVQAYLFGMLALIYVAGGIHSQQLQRHRKER